MQNSKHCARIYPLRILSRKWSFLVLRALNEPRTFSQIQKELRFITNRILSRELELLKGEKLIEPSEGKYKITVAGKELVDATETLAEWAVKHCGSKLCSNQQKCSKCADYPITIGARNFKNP